MLKSSIPAAALTAGIGKHKRDKKNLTTDETRKPVFENHFRRDKTCFAGNKTRLTRDETRFRRRITKNSGETGAVSREMKNFSGEVKPITRETFFISLMFSRSIRTKINNFNIIIN
jgi:hypothetical protein